MIGEYDRLRGFVLLVVSPVRLEQHGINLLEINGFCAVTHSFYHRPDTEVLDGSESTFRTSDDEVDGFLREGAVWQAYPVKLTVDVFGKGVRGESFYLG